MPETSPPSRTLEYGVAPGTGGVYRYTDPQGGIHFDIQPLTLRSKLKLRPVSGIAGSIGVAFGLGCVIVGPMVAWHLKHDPIIFMAYPAGAGATLLMIAGYCATRPQQTRIDADCAGLSVWVSGPFKPRLHRWPKQRIEKVEARWSMKDTGEGPSRIGGLHITADARTQLFLHFLADDEVLRIAAQLRDVLGLQGTG